ncbi:MAG: cyclodeaminase/cyclohydrolase family protein [Candidatus Omnitrophica bacterium]|nr:cyclodeaminase/cyclohydrolase family protein [Candidatus Omnitrophota bacterium]
MNSLRLDQIARRGSWYGGGSAVAFGCALAAALLEKLTSDSRRRAAIRRLRSRCLQLAARDADAFARVVRAQASRPSSAFRRALKDATRVPLEICETAQAVLKAASLARRTLSTAYQVDVECVEALARAAQQGARALALTNARWLSDPAYSRQVRRQLARLT